MISMREVRWPVRVRKVERPPRDGQPHGQLGHGVGHRHRVDGHVVQIDDGHRPLGGGPQEGGGHVVGGHPLEQVGGVDHEVQVQPGGAGDRPGGLLHQHGEPVGGGGVGLALEEPGQQQVALLPADQLLVGIDLVAPGQQAAGLELDEHRGDDQELGQRLQVDRLPGGHLGHEGVDHRGQGDVEDLHLVVVDQLQQQVDRALEGGGGDGGDHDHRPYRLAPPVSCTLAGPGPSPAGPRAPAARRPTMTPHVPSSVRSAAQR